MNSLTNLRPGPEYAAWLKAVEFVKTADLIISAMGVRGPFPPDKRFAVGTLYMVLCTAMEVALKAFLLARELTWAELRKKPYGHNLESLYAEACRRGLRQSVAALTNEDEELFRWLNPYFLEREWTYPEHLGYKESPHFSNLRDRAAALVVGLESVCDPRMRS